MRRKTIQTLGSLFLMLMVACGEGSSLDSFFSKRGGASNEDTANDPSNDEDSENREEEPKAQAPSVWPQVSIVNEEEFKYGIPDGDLKVEFQAETLEGFELQCRAAPVAEISEAEKESCEDSFEIDDYEKNQDYRFEVYAVHKASESERLVMASDFRTDPIVIIVPEEPFLKTQYSGIGYLTLTTSSSLPVYFTCSTASEVVWDPTLDCRDNTLRLEFTRYNGTIRLRLLAWSLVTNKLLAKRDFFFCSGYFCARNIHPPVSPPPY